MRKIKDLTPPNPSLKHQRDLSLPRPAGGPHDIAPDDRQKASGDLSRRSQLVAALGRLMPNLQRRRAELAADEAAVNAMIAELMTIESAAAPTAAARQHLTLDEAAGLAGCTRRTIRKYALQYGFGWRSGGRWRVNREGLMAFLSNSHDH